MAPSPDDDNTPKAPDKSDKQNSDKTKEKPKENGKDEETLSNLNYKELKALLDEAINYKNPKDREGKSELFNDLLLQAEETERIARATSAGGSELVRHCNPTARRHRHHGGPRGRRSTGCCASSTLDGRSVSERATHGGSLDNLAQEEFFESTRRLRAGRKSSTSSLRVSARQREGGSLPCNVNVGETQSDIHFLEEAKHTKALREKEYSEMETAGLLENDQLAQAFVEQAPAVESGPKYTSKATWQISGHAANVDDAIPMKLEQSMDSRNSEDVTTLKAKVVSSKYNIIIPSYTPKTRELEDKKVDENGNALHQKCKKKKIQTDKNVVVLSSEMIEGHKKEIINDVQQLVHYIEGTDNQVTAGSGKTRSLQSSKSKQLHKQHASEDGGTRTGKKRKSKEGSSVSGESAARPELKKSNSMGEISGLKLDSDFTGFGSGSGASSERGGGSSVDKEEDEKVVLRINKTSVVAGQRRSWGNVEIPSFQSLYNASSMENLETSTENWVVTRTKKKSKKRRNSVSSTGSRLRPGLCRSENASISPGGVDDRRPRRALSPDLSGVIVIGGKMTTRSMPHSEKSNDSSSDVDSVHSLPMDGPISYADIAKNSEKKKPSPEKSTDGRGGVPLPLAAAPKEKSPQPTSKPNPPVAVVENDPPKPSASNANNIVVVEKTISSAKDSVASSAAVAPKNSPPDVHNIKSFPAITASVSKTTTTSDKAVQSTIGYEETVRERTPTTSHITVVSIVSGTPNKALIRQSSGGNGGSKGKTAKGVVTVSTSSGTVQHQQSLQDGQIYYATGDIQTDLSIIQANESMQFNAQRLPPDVPDVQTIEKMQFMKCMSPPVAPVQRTTNHQQQQKVVIHQKGSGSQGGRVPQRQSSTTSPQTSDTPFCDNNNDERTGFVVNGVAEEESPEPPPVIILSGTAKEVPGLVFGFDVNEQLLQEDSGGGAEECDDRGGGGRVAGGVSDNFTARYLAPPEHASLSPQSLEKIVNFISSAFESVLAQNVQIYTDNL